MSKHPSPAELTYTPVSRSTMLQSVSDALQDVREKSRASLLQGRLPTAFLLNELHGRVVDTVVEVVTQPADPGTDSIRLRLASLDAQRVRGANRAAEYLATAARQVAA